MVPQRELSYSQPPKKKFMQSMLFDLPRRSSLGWQALYEHEVSFLRELSEHAGPEELGRRMRTVGSRPTGKSSGTWSSSERLTRSPVVSAWRISAAVGVGT